MGITKCDWLELIKVQQAKQMLLRLRFIANVKSSSNNNISNNNNNNSNINDIILYVARVLNSSRNQ